MKDMIAFMLMILLAISLTAGKCADMFSGDEDENSDDDDDDDDDNNDDADGDDDDDDADDGIPDDVNDFFDQDDLDALEEVGLVIYEGDDPPTIEGSYYLNSIEIIYDDADMWLNIVDYTYDFYDQSSDGEISMDYEAPEANDVAEGVGAFISGSKNCFSIFIDTTGVANGCHYKTPSVISGCLSSDGITEWRNAFIMREKSGDNCDQLIPEGHRRIISETDDLAESTTGLVPVSSTPRAGAKAQVSAL